MVKSPSDRKEHWEAVYNRLEPHQTSWYQERPDLSLLLIERSGLPADRPLIDIGGGASTLVDHLLALNYSDISILDVSLAALDKAKARLGQRAAAVNWITADVTSFEAKRTFALWHDRAVFHFLVDAVDRERYRSALDDGLETGGQLVISTFALDGPEKCSGLEIVRYDAASLARELGPGYHLEEQARESHHTPAGAIQRFGFYRFTKVA